jgi:hypothetical protein
LQTKASTGRSVWFFIYLDAVRREIGGHLYERLAKETEIQDIPPCFDRIVNVTRVPMIPPVTPIGKEHRRIIQEFHESSVSLSDSVVLADAVYFNAAYFITTDNRLLRNSNAINLATTRFDIKIVSPTQFLNSFDDTNKVAVRCSI